MTHHPECNGPCCQWLDYECDCQCICDILESAYLRGRNDAVEQIITTYTEDYCWNPGDYELSAFQDARTRKEPVSADIQELKNRIQRLEANYKYA